MGIFNNDSWTKESHQKLIYEAVKCQKIRLKLSLLAMEVLVCLAHDFF